MDRLDDLRRAAGLYVPEYPPMAQSPVRYEQGFAFDVLEPELENKQVPKAGG